MSPVRKYLEQFISNWAKINRIVIRKLEKRQEGSLWRISSLWKSLGLDLALSRQSRVSESSHEFRWESVLGLSVFFMLLVGAALGFFRFLWNVLRERSVQLPRREVGGGSASPGNECQATCGLVTQDGGGFFQVCRLWSQQL